MSNDLKKLSDTFDELGIKFTVRTDGDYSYLFVGQGDDASEIGWMDDNFETTDLELLQLRNDFFEFENNKLVSYP